MHGVTLSRELLARGFEGVDPRVQVSRRAAVRGAARCIAAGVDASKRRVVGTTSRDIREADATRKLL